MVKRLFIFGKAQVSAFLGGVVDYLLMIFITEFFGVHYVFSIGIGGVAGAIVNFLLNRNWTFLSKELDYHSSIGKQLSKFIIVLINSILLKSSGTYFFTTFLNIDYKIGRIMTDLLVSILLNYTLQKHWVFKKVKKLT
jgi:putative flippase GtrA